MICINCFHTKTSVINSRPHVKTSGTWRRRSCPQCDHTFTTYERPALDNKVVVLGVDGDKTHFSLSKLTLSIAASFTHDTTARQLHSLPLAETVEQLILQEVHTPSRDDIAAYTHQVLKRFDELAALQYAAQHGLVESVRRRKGRPGVRPSGSAR